MSAVRPRSPREEGIPALTTFTILLCVALWAMIVSQGNTTWERVAGWGYLPDHAILEGAYWGLVTGAFVHVDPIHLAFNMYWLFILGGAMERSLGPLKWVAFVLAAAAVSSGLQLLSGSAGIGFSGVGYAMFGFAWLTKDRYPAIARITTYKLIGLFIGWGILSIVLTYANIMIIGNFAHAAGLAFGALVGAWVVLPKRRLLFSLGLVLLTAGAVTSLFWNPMSSDWVAIKAMRAVELQDYPSAIQHYHRYLKLGGDRIWAWRGLAEIYGYQSDKDRYREAIEELESLDHNAAQEVIKAYGKAD
jgi:membrane associated rhomboid family serine protease